MALRPKDSIIKAQQLKRVAIGRDIATRLTAKLSRREVGRMLGLSGTMIEKIELGALYKLRLKLTAIRERLI